jgi:hypothetical protein
MKGLSRREFGKSLGIGVTALTIISSGAGGLALADSGSSASTFESPFANFLFGQTPVTDMICTRGVCLDPQFKADFSRYKMPLDISFFGSVEIGTPVYDYFENRLMRIVFSMVGNENNFNADLQSVVATFGRLQGMTLVRKIRLPLSDKQEVWVNKYMTGQGHVVEIDRRKRHGLWVGTWVKYYDKVRLDEFNLTVNPKYIPQ